MRYFLASLFFCFSLLAYGQHHADDVKAFQASLNKEYKDPEKSPLLPKALKRFKNHDFFPIDSSYRVQATLTTTENTPFFQMKTTTERLPSYRKFGLLQFNLQGKDFTVPVYQSKDLMRMKGYEDYLFLPFTDESNGKESYEGGRYLELRLPKEGSILEVDFNKAYNPYCAYNPKYSCPIVPEENHLPIAVRAGVRYIKKDVKK